ncbi:uncharacterized protein EI90DRAFT_2463419 [Cantharellus anzutake]|uniref:uncharacterized protein n=1 Tax=Cantharellus anzutake TaxID=1750568 RepID=UPI0019055A90|nr:uncharacterized protein EI90DRAFT_2463419 [Cantharellus anzutake]KAF8339123.1 hypothetical protein EI90DRAFT_2463419 [Cantharellus anzutake]
MESAPPVAIFRGGHQSAVALTTLRIGTAMSIPSTRRSSIFCLRAPAFCCTDMIDSGQGDGEGALGTCEPYMLRAMRPPSDYGRMRKGTACTFGRQHTDIQSNTSGEFYVVRAVGTGTNDDIKSWLIYCERTSANRMGARTRYELTWTQGRRVIRFYTVSCGRGLCVKAYWRRLETMAPLYCPSRLAGPQLGA